VETYKVQVLADNLANLEHRMIRNVITLDIIAPETTPNDIIYRVASTIVHPVNTKQITLAWFSSNY